MKEAALETGLLIDFSVLPLTEVIGNERISVKVLIFQQLLSSEQLLFCNARDLVSYKNVERFMSLATCVLDSILTV